MLFAAAHQLWERSQQTLYPDTAHVHELPRYQRCASQSSTLMRVGDQRYYCYCKRACHKHQNYVHALNFVKMRSQRSLHKKSLYALHSIHTFASLCDHRGRKNYHAERSPGPGLGQRYSGLPINPELAALGPQTLTRRPWPA